MKTNIIILAYLLFIAVGARGQSVGPSTYNNTGGTGTIGTNTFDWSIGEMPVISSYISSAFSVTQGVLQPYETVTNAVHDQYLTSNLQVYPTPADNTIFLQPSFSTGGILQYSLQDIAGKVLALNEVKLVAGNEKQSLNMTGFAVGVYMLRIVYKQGDKTYTAPYKIQKVR